MKAKRKNTTAADFFPGLDFVRDFPHDQHVPGKRDGSGRCFWSVTPTGDGYADTTLGEDYALAALRFLTTAEGPTRSLLVQVAHAQALGHAELAKGP